MISITLDARYVLTENKRKISAFINDRGIVRYPIEDFDMRKLKSVFVSIENVMNQIFKVPQKNPNKDY